MSTGHPRVAGFVDDHPGTTRILCPYCGCLHIHGRSPGNRVPHCGDKRNLPEYEIVLIDIPVPIEVLRINREAQRIHKILRNRRCSPCRDKSNKPDLSYKEEIEGLAAEARSLNKQILAEVSYE